MIANISVRANSSAGEPAYFFIKAELFRFLQGLTRHLINHKKTPPGIRHTWRGLEIFTHPDFGNVLK